MQINEFIRHSVGEVIEGMQSAETETHKFGIDNDGGNGIEFDIAVTAESSAEGSVGANFLRVVDVKGRGSVSGSTTHRLRFTIIPRGKRTN